MNLFWIGGTGFRDANPMIRKRGMQVRRLDFRHMTRYAILCRDRASAAGTIGRLFLIGDRDVTPQAIHIVGAGDLYQRLVRVVACDAGDSRVSLCPALTVLQTIGREPDVELATGDHLA